MKKHMKITFLVQCMLVWVLTAANNASAVPFQLGDVFAGTSSGTVEHWRPGTGLLTSYASGGSSFVTGMAFDAGGDLYVTNFGNQNVYSLAGPGDPHTASFFVNQSGNPESIVFDKNGDVYVGSASGGFINKYNAAGTLLLTRNTGGRADWIDLSADNTKLFFTEDVTKGVFILDIASGTRSTFNASLGNFALRILADGSVLVANSTDVVLLDNTGSFVRNYDVAGVDGWFALNLDPDGATFWSASFNGPIQQFDIATGATLTSFSSGASGGPWGLAVFGEITQGGPGDDNEIPEPGTLFLFGAGLLGAVGVARKKKS